MWKLIANRKYETQHGYSMDSSTTYVATTLGEVDEIIRMTEHYGVGEFTYEILPPRGEEGMVEPLLKKEEGEKNE